ncbi:tRNA 2'-phosphotransferase 1 isoform X2 [Nematostella vectensis]|uniref:tRNA 2'-phosphotransferase 1 isoform X2 n=1 Tax=Nematostella vectensis TaxID=45351 RepID=UPI0020777993|nr:tRNA 2'-phosphotransferase 1 isoform X2 [Nematostella vectensis]
MANRNHGTRKNSHDIKLSKALSYICRHGAAKEGLQMNFGGLIFVDEILKLRQFCQFTEEDVRRVVKDNDKQRFVLATDEDSGRLQVAASQGHTMEVQGLDLSPITDKDMDKYPTVIHGTYLNSWQSIKKQGLSRMARNHIHFAPGVPGEEGVISGMRSSCQLLIYINLKKALNDGYEFFTSTNNVILCPGNVDGLLPPCYFDQVIQLKPVRQILSVY